MIRESKKVYFKHLLETSENKTKTLWTITNKATRKVEKSNHLPHLFKMNNKEVSIEKSAEVFNNYFLNIADDFQIQIDVGVFPDHLKYAIVKPLFKNWDRSSILNYRPISLLPVFSKMLEKTMYSRLNQHLIINNILTMEQYGFREGQSTKHAAYTLINRILQAWNSKLQVAGNFCDLAKAFNYVNHDILIEKLKYYGVNETGINWIKSYLHNRRQRVDISVNNIQHYSSTWEIVKRGVPQGSDLGPPHPMVSVHNDGFMEYNK